MSQILWNLGTSAEYQSSLSPDTQSTCWSTHRLILGWHVSGQSVDMLADLLPNNHLMCQEVYQPHQHLIGCWPTCRHTYTMVKLSGYTSWQVVNMESVKCHQDIWGLLVAYGSTVVFSVSSHTIKYKHTNQSIHTVQNTCVVPENIQTSTTKGISNRTPHPFEFSFSTRKFSPPALRKFHRNIAHSPYPLKGFFFL